MEQQFLELLINIIMFAKLSEISATTITCTADMRFIIAHNT